MIATASDGTAKSPEARARGCPERRLSSPGDPGTLDHLRATLAVLRRALLED
jgi:hypothetical protein